MRVTQKKTRATDGRPGVCAFTQQASHVASPITSVESFEM